jgi:threonine aldolase
MSTPTHPDSFIDMRSDTVTRPTPGMLEAMMRAEVGDDVFGDDPTVNRLQEVVAGRLGKEAALFVPSGTMSNQLALKAQTQPGDQIVLEDGAHIYRYEGGGPAALGGLLMTCVATPDGLLDWSRVEAVLNPDDVHYAPPALICLENTHLRSGGRVLPQNLVQEIAAGAHGRGLRVHLDGARLWHAHVASGRPLADLAAPVDSVSVCFSKALGAPVGSVLAADTATITRAHRLRKMWGGGMRQAGILAAACLFALDHHLNRLAEDHENARALATGLDHPDLRVNHPVETNIVIIDVDGPGRDEALLTHLEECGVRGVKLGTGQVRLMPHLEHSAQDISRAVEALNSFTGAPK